MTHSSVLIRSGLVFDGLGNDGVRSDILVENGRIKAVATNLLAEAPADMQVIDADGKWVMPGFIDVHTHYDAEVEVMPDLNESLRHGVTTVVLGSCGLSLAVGDAEDLADMFTRVEGIPRAQVLPLLRERKTWEGPASYLEHLRSLPLGPNVACFLGHSTIRAAAMSLERSMQPILPSSEEYQRMDGLLHEALDAGYLGLSLNALTFDKMDGSRFRSQPTPSTFARWSEYRHFMRILRRRERILQVVPSITNLARHLRFYWASTGLGRKSLKTSILAMIDGRAIRNTHRVLGTLARLMNGLFKADLRMQALPGSFELYVDGMEAPVFEEFAAGTEILHREDVQARAALLGDPTFRQRFSKQWHDRITPRAFHRNLDDTEILEAPEAALVGRSFSDIAKDRGVDVLDSFLDLVAAYGTQLRWRTVVANDRPDELAWIFAHPSSQVGFSDAGAHLRNMANYNFPLRLLHFMKSRGEAGQDALSIPRTVHRLTAELANWFGLETGKVLAGHPADLVVLDPQALDARVDEIHEASMPAFDGLHRLVRRNPGLVTHVLVNGRIAWENEALASGVGVERGFGRVLTASL